LSDASEDLTSAGRRISRYEILEKIGQGGMGEVFLARDTSLDRLVALKFLPGEARGDTTERKRFVRGAKSAAALDHPYICKIYEVGEVEGKLFIAMEYVRGETLGERLTSGELSHDEVTRIAREIAEALEAAHGEDIVHRDLKPSNIMLTVGGHVKVLDFGLAKRVLSGDSGDSQYETASRLTGEGSTLGTLAYMSPEQVRGQAVDPRSDIFSFGVVLYQMIARRHPFGQKTSIDTVAAILNQDPAPLADDVPLPLRRVVARMLEKTPENRYQRIGDVLADLEVPRTPEYRKRSLALAPKTRRGLVLAAAAVAIAVSIAWLVSRFAPTPTLSSVAVIPFANLSQEPLETDYLADGLSEEIRARLASSGFRTASFEASSRFRDSSEPARAIARELSVDGILTGAFRFAGDRVLASLSLIDGESGERLWSEELESPYEDLFDLQSRIAEEVASRLQPVDTPDTTRLNRTPTTNLQAYDLYLQGRYIMNDGTRDASDVALRYFDRAVDLDPDFAAARIHAGALHFGRYNDGWGKGLPSLDLAEGHFQKAIKLEPGSIQARRGRILVLAERGRSEACLLDARAIVQAGRLDDAGTLVAVADAYSGSGLTELALPLYREAVAVDSANQDAHYGLVAASTASGRFADAMEAGRTYTRRFGDSHDIETLLAMSYHASGDRFGAKAHYARAVQLATSGTGRNEPFGVSAALDAFLYGGLLDQETESWRRGSEMARAKSALDSGNPRMRIYHACFEALLKNDATLLDGVIPESFDTTMVRHVASVLARLGDPDRAARILRDALGRGRLDRTWRVALQLASVSPDEEPFVELRPAFESRAQRLADAYPPPGASSGRTQ
jgi:serine/threonine protein kinase